MSSPVHNPALNTSTTSISSSQSIGDQISQIVDSIAFPNPFSDIPNNEPFEVIDPPTLEPSFPFQFKHQPEEHTYDFSHPYVDRNDNYMPYKHHNIFSFSIFPSASLAKTILPREFALYDPEYYGSFYTEEDLLVYPHNENSEQDSKYGRHEISSQWNSQHDNNFEKNFRNKPNLIKHQNDIHSVATTLCGNKHTVLNSFNSDQPMATLMRFKSMVVTPIDNAETIRHFLSLEIANTSLPDGSWNKASLLPSDRFNIHYDNKSTNYGTIFINIYLHGDSHHYLVQDGALNTSTYIKKTTLYNYLNDVCADFGFSPIIIDNSCSTADFPDFEDLDQDPNKLHHFVLSTISKHANSVPNNEKPKELHEDYKYTTENLMNKEHMFSNLNNKCLCQHPSDRIEHEYGCTSYRYELTLENTSSIWDTYYTSCFPSRADFFIHSFINECNMATTDNSTVYSIISSLAPSPDARSIIDTNSVSSSMPLDLISSKNSTYLNKLANSTLSDAFKSPQQKNFSNMLPVFKSAFLDQINSLDFNSPQSPPIKTIFNEPIPIPDVSKLPFGYGGRTFMYGQNTSRSYIIKSKPDTVVKFLGIRVLQPNHNPYVIRPRDRVLITPSYIAISTFLEYIRSRSFKGHNCHQCICTMITDALNDVDQYLNTGSFSLFFDQCFQLDHNSIINTRIRDKSRCVFCPDIASNSHFDRATHNDSLFPPIKNCGDLFVRQYLSSNYKNYLPKLYDSRHSYLHYLSSLLDVPFDYEMAAFHITQLLFSISDPSKLALIPKEKLPSMQMILDSLPRIGSLIHSCLHYMLLCHRYHFDDQGRQFTASSLKSYGNKLRHKIALTNARELFNKYPPNFFVFSNLV